MTFDWGALTAPCRDAFGEKAQGFTVTWLPAAGGTFAIDGVFDDAYREVGIAANGNAVTSTHPILGVRVADLPAAPLQGDKLTLSRNGRTYVVKEVRPDSHGWAILLLNKAP
jgi:hypothetical protein